MHSVKIKVTDNLICLSVIEIRIVWVVQFLCSLIFSFFLGVNNVSEEVCTAAFFRAVLGFSEHLGAEKQYLQEVHLVHSDSDSSALSVLHLRQLVAESQQQTSPRYHGNYR